LQNHISDFRSDTVTRPTPRMREAMAQAVVGDDVFGDDPTVKRLEAKAAELLGKQAALFVCSGTMGNEIAVKVWTNPGDEIIVERDSHIYLYESASTAFISGVQTCPIESEDGSIPLEKIRAAIRDASDLHCPRTALICVENTHNMKGGRVLAIDYLRRLKRLASEYSIPVHLDGARLFNASCASGVPAREYAAEADSVMFCLSKGLSAPIGSILVGDDEFIEKARRVRKALGGGMRQVGVIAAPGLVALEEMIDRLGIDHENARRLALGLAELPGLVIDPQKVETNIIMLQVRPPAPSANLLCARLAEHGILAHAFDETTIRFVTHKDIGEADVERLINTMAKLIHD